MVLLVLYRSMLLHVPSFSRWVNIFTGKTNTELFLGKQGKMFQIIFCVLVVLQLWRTNDLLRRIFNQGRTAKVQVANGSSVGDG